MEENVPANAVPAVNNRKKPEMTSNERKEMIIFLILRMKPGTDPPVLKRGALVEAAKNFDRSKCTMGRAWRVALQNYQETGALRATPKKKPGKPRKYCPDQMRAQIALFPPYQKRTLRLLANSLNVSVSVVHRYKEWGLQDDNPVILAHSNVLMPDLTDEHKVARVLYARDKLDTELRSYDDFLNSVHVDEKWFLPE
jgi:hypothetical protein